MKDTASAFWPGGEGVRRRSRLRAKLLAVNEYADRVGCAPIPQAKLDGILGDNYARMLGLLPA